MNHLLLRCEGTMINSIEIPPFQLHLGEFLCLHLPALLDSPDEKQLIRALIGECHLPGLQVLGRIISVERPLVRAGLLGLFLSRKRPAEWLSRAAGISESESAAIVARLDIQPHWYIDQLAGNARTLLGLEAAWARGAEGIVFSASGWCDPRGYQAVNEAVLSRLDKCAAIHISRCDVHGEWPCQQFFPKAKCIALTKPGSPQPIAPSSEVR